ncbi:glycosyltransferase family 4 protein [Fibrobacterota bacterium]
MKIVILVPGFPKLSETFIINKFLGLLRMDIDVSIVCQRKNTSDWQYFPQLARDRKLRKKIHAIPPHGSAFPVVFLFPFVFLFALFAHPAKTVRYLVRGKKKFGLSLIKRFYLDAKLIQTSPDIIHFEFGALAARQMYLSELLNCRLVVSFRGYDINYVGLEDPGYYTRVWRQAHALHFLGKDLWNRAKKRGCPESKPVYFIPPAIDTGLFNPGEKEQIAERGTPESPLRILSVGRLEWKKGYEFALQSIRVLREKGIHCHYRIIGTGEHINALICARRHLELDSCVEILGPLQPAGVKKEMERSDVFLQASVSEGFCNAVMEAQAMKLPVVCTDADGLGENVKHGVTGFVVPRRSPRALADAMEKLARNPFLRHEYGEAGRNRIMNKFQLNDQIKLFADMYNDAVKEKY